MPFYKSLFFSKTDPLIFDFFASVASPYIKDQEFMSFVQAHFFLVIYIQKLQSALQLQPSIITQGYLPLKSFQNNAIIDWIDLKLM